MKNILYQTVIIVTVVLGMTLMPLHAQESSGQSPDGEAIAAADSQSCALAANGEGGPEVAIADMTATDATAASQKNLELLVACNLYLIAAGNDLLTVETDTTFDVFDKDLRLMIDGMSRTVKDLSGAGGSLEVMKRVQKQLESQVEEATENGQTPDNNEDIRKIHEQSVELTDVISDSVEAVDALNASALKLAKMRPEIARRIRSELTDDYIKAATLQRDILVETVKTIEAAIDATNPVADTNN